MAIFEENLIHQQLQWLTVYYSELLQWAPAEPNADATLLWRRINHHAALHTDLLFNALILGLSGILDTPGWDQKSGNSEKITLEHFVKKLSDPARAEAKALLKEARSYPAYADLNKARNNLIAHWNRKMLTGYTTPQEIFPHLTLEHFGELLRRVQEIAKMAIDPSMDFSIPGFEGVDKLLRVLRCVSKPSEGA